MDKILQIDNLVVRYDTSESNVRAINDVSLSLEVGQTLGLVGETGAGKTTLAKCIMGILPVPPGVIDSGTILYNDEDLLSATPDRMREIRGAHISMIFQDPMTSLNPVITVENQIAEVIATHNDVSKKGALDKAREMLELVGIPANRGREYPHQFSGGMKQRVIIAIALACNPKLLIADEPTTALDVTIQAQVLELMSELKKDLNTSLIIITHDLGIVAQICDYIAIMYAGQVVEYGNLREVFKDNRHPYTIGLMGSIPNLDADTDRLNPIPGLMPDPADLPTGCYFHPRCNRCTEKCTTSAPPVRQITDTHWVRCWLEDDNGGDAVREKVSDGE